MADIWFYAEGGETFGPVGAGEIAERLGKAKRQQLLVWAPGMSEWTDARSLPQFAVSTPGAAQGRGKTLAGRVSAAWRASHELISYLAVSGYLLVWFCAILVYKAAILRGVGVEFAPFGLAAAKALILGKFIAAPNTAKRGERQENGETLLIPTAKKALLFAIALFLLSVVEALVVGYFHGRGVKEIGGGAVTQAAATAVLMFLALLPYLAFRRFAQEFGEKLPELLFSRRAFGRRAERPDSI
ncbi:DUF4339 domain-containing protein [Methylocystis sp. MJC1]|jgi:hypothetical protein|uniref:DUF4339 domain-containing protein n=1 Tax=Methylocystis sp. MJC1 TaxID=2654282 RepID=UPI0013E9E997|nr:DUF4339 domain-containing protein [Methylocystis sp. MJC1]KAF2990028.1 hypothetical protein MJC1_02945 [Methylocystis sp. MJC1]MBU6528771.1 DUF4339 domain-containing protein [Methylocystis sp. MJC1]UZX11657.1 DUF4339 domain-containing protein [Methylocystis sp. MJC1]